MTAQAPNGSRLNSRWSESDVDALLELLGGSDVHVIAEKIGRSVAAVRVKASRLGVSTSVQPPVWCVRCATWRTHLDRDGRCPVCKMRNAADVMEDRWRSMAASKPVSDLRPVITAKRPPMAVIRAEEAAEVERHRARYNAAKMRLSRARRRDG